MQYFNKIKHYYFVLEYKIVAYSSFIFSKLKGSNYKSRTKKRVGLSGSSAEASITSTIARIPSEFSILVIDNGSSDKTVQRAKTAGADVIFEHRRGYGRAVHTGLIEAKRRGFQIAVILDADGSNHPEDIPKLIAPIIEEDADLVLGQRTRYATKDSLTQLQRYGNWLATKLILFFTGVHFSDMGAFRALRLSTLSRLSMQDEGFAQHGRPTLQQCRVGPA